MSLPNDADRARKGSARPRARWAVVGAGMAAVIFGATACVAAAGVANQILTITGSGGSDTIVLRLRAGDPNILEVDDGGNGSADFAFDRQTFTSIDVEGGGGNDVLRVDRSNGVFTDTESTTLSGGDGNDVLTGDVGSERLDGGAGNDVLDGNQDADVLLGGDGVDTVLWDPGDGSDLVEGGAGADRLQFNGSNISELFDVSANGGRVRLTRNVASIVMDLDDVETVDLSMAGGTDGLTVNDLSGTDLTKVNVNLAAAGGGDDGQADQVVVNGTAGNDTISVSDNGPTVGVSGLAASVNITGSTAALDRLTVNGLGGADTIAATPGASALIQLDLVP